MKTAFDGINEKTVTFEAEDGISAGDFVTVSGDGRVRKSTANEIPLGTAVEVRGSFAAVQISGYMKVQCDAALTLGFKKVAVNASGVLGVSAEGREAFILEMDSAAGTCGVLL